MMQAKLVCPSCGSRSDLSDVMKVERRSRVVPGTVSFVCPVCGARLRRVRGVMLKLYAINAIPWGAAFVALAEHSVLAIFFPCLGFVVALATSRMVKFEVIPEPERSSPQGKAPGPGQ